MRSIILSSAITARMTSSIRRAPSLQTVYGAFSNIFGSALAQPSTLKILKGVPPDNFSTLTGFTSRAADVLVNIAINPTGNDASFMSVLGNNTLKIDTSGTYTSAVGSGDATWFWICGGSTADQYGGSGVFTFGVMPQMIGTITAPGLGGDMILPIPTIVAGSPFKVSNFNINLDYASTY